MLARLVRWCLAFYLLLAAGMPARAKPVPYYLDQRYATIEFSTTGLIATQGYFQKFTGHLALDFQHPQNSSVDVTLDDTAITLSWPPGVQMLESPAYFDASTHPHIRFRSLSITPGKAGHYTILGTLTIRGITRTQVMDATLLRAPSRPDEAGTADFYVTGKLKRSAFGMVADQGAVGNVVTLRIHARVMLAQQNRPDGGVPHGQ